MALFKAIRWTGTRDILAMYHTGVGVRYSPTPVDNLPDLHNVMLFVHEKEARDFLRNVIGENKVFYQSNADLSWHPILYVDGFDIVDVEFTLASPDDAPVQLDDPIPTTQECKPVELAGIAEIKDRLDKIEDRLHRIELHNIVIGNLTLGGGPLV
jgi:hypothetical protein